MANLLLAGLATVSLPVALSAALLALTVLLFLAFVFLYLKNRSDSPAP